MEPHTKFSLEGFLGRPGWTKLFPKWLEKAENGDVLALRWIQDWAVVMVLACGVNLQVLPRDGALRLYYQPALITCAEEEELVPSLKGVCSQTSKMESDSQCFGFILYLCPPEKQEHKSMLI